MSADISNDGDHKGMVLFGRDVSTIPCFRSSFLYGIGGGVVSGLSFFMMTSRPRMSTHVGFGSFFCITISYWFYCRYQWSQKKFGVGQLQGVIKKPPQVFEASSAGEVAK